MTETRNSANSTKEWIIYHMMADGYRKAVGLFFGEFSQSESTVQWVKGGNSTILLIPISPLDAGYKERLTVLLAPNQTIFRIVPNQIGISAAFSGEKGCVHYFETSGKLMVSGKLKVKHKGNINIYSGQHSLYIDGIAAITIRNGLVVIDCRSGQLYFDQTLPNQLMEQMNAQLPERPRSPQRSTQSQSDRPFDKRFVSLSDTRPKAPPGWRRMDARDGYYLLPETFFGEPLDTRQRRSSGEEQRRNYTSVLEYVIYYDAGSNVLRPVATLIGTIEAQPIVQTYYEYKRNDGSIKTVLLNIDDTSLLRDAATVRHSTDLIVISIIGNVVAKIYGEVSGGFSFGSDSVLKIKGLLILSRRETDVIIEDLPIAGISIITVNSGCVSIIIGDNNETILLDEGFNNYNINHVSDGPQPSLLSDESSGQLVREVSPIQSTLGQTRDTGYGSDLKVNYTSTSFSGQSTSSSLRRSQSLSDFETRILRRSPSSSFRQSGSLSPSLSLDLSSIRNHQR